MQPIAIPNVDKGIFCQCPRCTRWWHKSDKGVLVGPVDGVTGGPKMDGICPACVDVVATTPVSDAVPMK